MFILTARTMAWAGGQETDESAVR